MEFSLIIRKDEIPILQKMVALANSIRAKFFAPALALYMLTEFFSDFRKMLSPSRAGFTVSFLGYTVNAYRIFVAFDLLIIAFSIAVFASAFFFQRKKDERQKFFLSIMRSYLVVLLTVSFIAVVVTVYAFGAVDFTFFYLISLVCAGVFFSDAILFIPLCIGYFTSIHIFIALYPHQLASKPHVPYGIFLIVALCFISIFRGYYLLSTIRYEREIEQLKDKAVQQNTLKSTFLANMSHEIRTPMNAIVGMSELAQDFDLPPAQKNTIRQIRSSGIALVSIVNDILDFSKIEAGKMEILPSDYDLLTLLYDIASICIVKLSGKSVDVRIQVEQDLPRILHGDDIRLRQVLVNLTGNAAKFTDKGSICIRAVRSGYGRIAFSVSDTGIGIKKDDLASIFQEFQQVDMSMNRTRGGTGLGLAISKSLVHLMGGTLTVESEYQKGSVFSFSIPQEAVSEATVGEAYLPIMQVSSDDEKNPGVKDIDARILSHREFSGLFAPQTSSASPSSKLDFSAASAKILVVDDNQVNIQVAEGMLEKFSIIPDTAISGFECLEKMAEKSYDIVFLDHQMPVMDGVETLKKIRLSEGNAKHTVVIALSANAVNGAREMFIQNGFDDFVSKPVQIKDFATSLKKWLPAQLIQQSKPKKTQGKAGSLQESKDWTCPPAVIKTFVKLIDTDAQEIAHFLEHKDIKNYTIKVHALKSSAKIVGEDQLSKMAAEVEELGLKAQKDGELSLLQQKTPALLSIYKACKDHFKDFADGASTSASDAPGEKSKEALSKEMLSSFATRIKSACQENNLNELESLVESLKKYDISALSPQEKNALNQIEEAAEIIDFDSALKATSYIIA